jgi:hypothetical protein
MDEKEQTTNNNSNNGIWKTILGWVLTVVVSVILSVYSSGEASGTQKEKVAQLEAKVAVLEKSIKDDHDLLIINIEALKSIDHRLTNIELMLQEQRGR